MPARRGRLLIHFRRRLISFGAAFAAGFLVWFFSPDFVGASRFVAAYDAFALVLLVLFWTIGVHDDAERTQRRAAISDPGRNVALLTVLVVVAVGLTSAIAILARGPHVHNDLERNLAYAFGIGGVVLGWLMMHTVYVFRYAHLYYYDAEMPERYGGLRFPGDAIRPDDYDFAYFSFVIGMTFQVSDVEITDPEIRREALFHALMSFAYNSIIVGMVINVLAGLFASASGK